MQDRSIASSERRHLAGILTRRHLAGILERRRPAGILERRHLAGILERRRPAGILERAGSPRSIGLVLALLLLAPPAVLAQKGSPATGAPVSRRHSAAHGAPASATTGAAGARRHSDSWSSINARITPSIYRLHVGMKMRIGDSLYAYLNDLSPKLKLPVFGVTNVDKGHHIVAFGTAFAVKTMRTDRTFFITNRHVAATGENIIAEAERFFAAARLHAEQNSTPPTADRKFAETLNKINLSFKGKDMNMIERMSYQSTVDAIWDTYEKHLSMQADPRREKFKKYAQWARFSGETAFYLHPVSNSAQKKLQATKYMIGKMDSEADLAVLSVNDSKLPKLELSTAVPTPGLPVQVVGYGGSEKKADPFSPRFELGCLKGVTPRTLDLTVQVAPGDSGAPVIDSTGKVVGVVVQRAATPQELQQSKSDPRLPRFASALPSSVVRTFASALFYAAPRPALNSIKR